MAVLATWLAWLVVSLFSFYLLNLLAHARLNLISRTIFSVDLTSLDDHGGSEDFQEVITAMKEGLGTPNVSDFFPVLAAADLQGMRRRLARIFARLHAVFDAEVDQRLRGRDAGQPRKNDYLDVLLDVAPRDEGKDLLDRDTLRSQFTVTHNNFLLCDTSWRFSFQPMNRT
uniref:Cytochrome P450 76C2 n=1 Tax=Aegilops tauschii TaxID=37682 RepID=M8B4U3_AEGTA